MAFYTSAAVGYRSWKMGSGRCLLQGRLTADYWSHDGPTEAKCSPPNIAKLAEKKEPHEAPDMDCLCGIYAWKSEQLMWERSVDSVRSVFGAIIAWGRVIEHRYGFRSQYALPIVFAQRMHDSSYDWNKLLDQVAELYGIPVVAANQLGERARERGPLLDEFASI